VGLQNGDHKQKHTRTLVCRPRWPRRPCVRRGAGHRGVPAAVCGAPRGPGRRRPRRPGPAARPPSPAIGPAGGWDARPHSENTRFYVVCSRGASLFRTAHAAASTVGRGLRCGGVGGGGTGPGAVAERLLRQAKEGLLPRGAPPPPGRAVPPSPPSLFPSPPPGRTESPPSVVRPQASLECGATWCIGMNHTPSLRRFVDR